MLNENQKIELNSFLLTQLGWYDLNFCICDEKQLGQLSTKIYVNQHVEYEQISKLFEFLKCKKLYIKTIDKKDFNLVIWWI